MRKGGSRIPSFKTRLKTLPTFLPDALKKARASGRNVGKVFNRVLKLVFENHPFSSCLLLALDSTACWGLVLGC